MKAVNQSTVNTAQVSPRKVTQSVRLALALSTMSLLAGCQLLGPMFSRPADSLPAQYPEGNAVQSTAESQQALATWWTLFADTQLNTLVEKALANNTNIQVAVARIEEADAQAKEVGANILPTVTLDSTNTRSRVTGAGAFPVFGPNPRDNYKLALNAAIELDFWGKLKRANEAARANLLATQFAKETVKWSLSSLVANHYLMVRSIDSQLMVNANNLKTAQESLALAQRRVAGGVSSILDVHQAELVVVNLQSQALEYQRLRALSEHQLGLLTADLSTKIAAADVMAMPVPPVPPSGLPSQLMDARPDIRQAEQQLVAANANIGLAKAALYPTVSLTGAYGGESLELTDIMKSLARVWTLGLDVSLPIFNGGRLNSRVDQANARQKQALASYIGASQTAFTEVSDALVNARVYRERETVAQSKQTITQNMLNVAQNRYKAGYSSYLEVLDAQRSHNEATQAFVQSRQDSLTSTVYLLKALGGGWSDTTVMPASQKAAPTAQ
jgi:outer membrane protein, multidrug efflux system